MAPELYRDPKGSLSHLEEKEDQGWKEGDFRAECPKETEDSKLGLFKSGVEEREGKGRTERERQRDMVLWWDPAILMSNQVY